MFYYKSKDGLTYYQSENPAPFADSAIEITEKEYKEKFPEPEEIEEVTPTISIEELIAQAEAQGYTIRQ